MERSVLSRYIRTSCFFQESIGNDKVITFAEISEAFNVDLNRGSAGVTIASLKYKDSRVNLYIKPDTQLTNVKISEDIARELKIKPDRSNTGEPIDNNKIAFHNTPNIYLTCDQADCNTFIDSRNSKTVLTGVSFDAEIEVISFDPSPPAPFHAPVGQLTFHIQDERDNNLPVKRLFCQLNK